MNRPLLAAATALACVFGAALPASAQTHSGEPAIAVGVTGGTTGGGAEVQFALGPIFVLRGAVDTLGYDLDESYDGIDYTGRLDFDTLGAFIDLHPLANGFFISGGAYMGERNIGLNATPTGPVSIGGQTFTPSQVGTLTGEIKLQELAPFAGLGYDNTFTRNSRWGLRAVVGVAWSDTPEVGLDSTGGSLSNDPTFRARLADEARTIQSDVEGYGFYPVVQLGLNYKF
jgi:hypothetical protein